MEAGKFTGLGAGSGGAYWNEANILAMSQYSPQLALAKAMRVPFQPYVLTIENTFNSGDPLISNYQSFGSNTDTGGSKLVWPTIVDGVMFEVDSPNLFAGNTLASLNQYFFGLQSSIRANMIVVGSPKYSVAPNFVPLRSLCAMINESWPCGWVLQPMSGIQMQFQQFVAVPSTPTTIVVSFRMWQPIDAAGFFAGMSDDKARQLLTQYGITT